jgi:VanZ family protein
MLESTEMFGSDHTSGPLRRLWEALFGPVASVHWDRIHHLVRKCGHFFGYGFIGVAWLRAWWMTLPHSRFLDDAVLALLGTSLVASLDELHQTHLPNRTGSIWDVLLDCSGVLVLQLVVYTYVRLTRPNRLERAK